MNCLSDALPKKQRHEKPTPSDIVFQKHCVKCNTTKNTSEFRAAASRKDGCAPWCRSCEREYQRGYRSRRRPAVVPSTREARLSPEYWPAQLSQQEARGLFEYEPVNGDLIFRSTGRRALPGLERLILSGVDYPLLEIDGAFYRLHVLVWNWHRGITDQAVTWKDGNRLNNKIHNLREVPPVKLYDGARLHNRFATQVNLSEPIRCPCCFQETWRPTLDVVADVAGLQPMEKKVLAAIWAGNGLPVENERIFLSMYADDPDGGPEPSKMYSALKVALSYMRGKLRGTGVNVESTGYRKGYRLVLGE
jgi:hypothetical protein